MGLILVGDSEFFFVPGSCHVDQFTFHISAQNYQLYSLINGLLVPKFVKSDGLCKCVVRILQLTLEKYGTCNKNKEFIRFLF